MAAYAAPPQLDQPPASPEVTDQQGPVARFVEGYQGGGGQPGGGAQDATALLERNMNEVAAKLKEVAQTLSQFKPNLLPVLERMIQAGSFLMNQLQSAKPGMQAGKASVERSQPEPPMAEGGSPPLG